jgi:hypothetical protein
VSHGPRSGDRSTRHSARGRKMLADDDDGVVSQMEYADAELAALRRAGRNSSLSASTGDDAAAYAAFDFEGQEPVPCLPTTAMQWPHETRAREDFFDKVLVTLPDGTERTLERKRDLDDDHAVIAAMDSGVLIRIRVEDLVRDENGVGYVLGSRLYTRSQLDASAESKLPSSFDTLRELVESLNQVAIPLVSIAGFSRVVSSAQAKELKRSDPDGNWAHQGTAFVDENDTSPWELVKNKERPHFEDHNDRSSRRRRRG